MKICSLLIIALYLKEICSVRWKPLHILTTCKPFFFHVQNTCTFRLYVDGALSVGFSHMYAGEDVLASSTFLFCFEAIHYTYGNAGIAIQTSCFTSLKGYFVSILSS